jgi:hypothetical protein
MKSPFKRNSLYYMPLAPIIKNIPTMKYVSAPSKPKMPNVSLAKRIKAGKFTDSQRVSGQKVCVIF